eukprot:gene51237-62648_t
MNPADIAGGLKLCRKAKWNQLEADWQIFLQHSPGACIVAIFQDQIVGTVTTIRYGHSFSWIGMVLVDPDFRRKGIGQQLLQEALQLLQAEETVKLDATPAGREVYLKLNFVDEYPLTRMSRVHRSSLLQWMSEKAPGFAFLIEEGVEIKGYAMGRYGHDFIHIGPIKAQNIGIAQDLLIAALNSVFLAPALYGLIVVVVPDTAHAHVQGAEIAVLIASVSL